MQYAEVLRDYLTDHGYDVILAGSVHGDRGVLVADDTALVLGRYGDGDHEYGLMIAYLPSWQQEWWCEGTMQDCLTAATEYMRTETYPTTPTTESETTMTTRTVYEQVRDYRPEYEETTIRVGLDSIPVLRRPGDGTAYEASPWGAEDSEPYFVAVYTYEEGHWAQDVVEQCVSGRTSVALILGLTQE